MRRYGVFLAGILLAGLSLLALQWGASGWLTALENRSGDWVWAAASVHAPERRLIVVDVDERSIAEVGPWPWPRPVQARLIEQIALAGARQQVLDIVFADEMADGQALAAVFARHRPVLAQVFALEQGGSPSSGTLAGALNWATCPAPFEQAQGYLANAPGLVTPTPDLAAAVPPLAPQTTGAVPAQPATDGERLHAGHITPRIASDGVMRHQPAVICMGTHAYPALALSALIQGGGVSDMQLQRGDWTQAPWLLKAATFPDGVPLDQRGDLRIPWRLHPDSFISLSAADVLAGRFPANVLEGAWVLIGSSAFGLNDTIATPFGGAASGLQAHAQLIVGLIDGRMPATPRIAPLLQILAGLFGALLLLPLARTARNPTLRGGPQGARPPSRNPVYLLPLAGLTLGLALWLLHGVLQVVWALWLGWAAPVLFLVFAGLYLGVLAHAQSRIDRDRLFTHLSSYLPAPVAAALALQPPSSAIQAETRQVSVLFADIRNFSAYCEARPPEEAAAVLHAFFSTATRVVQAHGGVIEAFQGDAIIAVWNGELQETATRISTHHAEQALRAAIELHHAAQGVLPDPAPEGLEPLSLGVGVETGPAMTGSFGLSSRRTHMVMGRTVTIASRLVEMTADLAHPILVGEGLAGQIGASGLQSMGTFLLDGMRVPHHIYAHPLDATHRID